MDYDLDSIKVSNDNNFVALIGFLDCLVRTEQQFRNIKQE
jgi:hypothetical protein